MGAKVILAGGRGFLGAALAAQLSAEGREVVVLTRTPAAGAATREVAWDGRTPGPWVAELEGAEAVVNLAGRSVNCVHTPENRRQILESRVNSVKALGDAVARCNRPPAAWIQSGSLALYGDAGDRLCDETAPEASDFSAGVCREWEAALATAATPRTRQVLLRIGLVLGPGGGALGPLTGLVRWFLGGTVGSGRQYLSWLHVDDMSEIVRQAISRPDFSGAYNACAPQPVTNADFMRELRGALRRPWSPPAPEWAVRLGARYLFATDADLALTGRRCVPARLTAQGFRFRFPELKPALADLVLRGL